MKLRNIKNALNVFDYTEYINTGKKLKINHPTVGIAPWLSAEVKQVDIGMRDSTSDVYVDVTPILEDVGITYDTFKEMMENFDERKFEEVFCKHLDCKTYYSFDRMVYGLKTIGELKEAIKDLPDDARAPFGSGEYDLGYNKSSNRVDLLLRAEDKIYKRNELRKHH